MAGNFVSIGDKVKAVIILIQGRSFVVVVKILLIIFPLCICYGLGRLLWDVLYKDINYYFECSNPPTFLLPGACPKICMRIRHAPFRRNARKNKRFFLSCLENLLEYLKEDKTYQCKTHLIIKNRLERHDRIEIISCVSIKPRALVFEEAMVDGCSLVKAFFRKPMSPRKQFYHIKFRVRSRQV